MNFDNESNQMKVTELIQSNKETAFSFEVLPPLKGNSIEKVFHTIDLLREFDPKYINITTHRSEIVYRDTDDGLYKRISERRRPGTVAIAAAIQNKYQIPAVPHVICSGFTKSETEYVLIDLSFLGIYDIFILRGDKAKHESCFIPTADGHEHAIDLQRQVNRFNEGYFLDGTRRELNAIPFSYGVAGYPEKHDEAPNMQSDIAWLKAKVDAGADYVVTQMFFYNERYFQSVESCRQAGIHVPIIPGIKPITACSQLTVLPKIFHIDLPEPLAVELAKCKSDEEAKEVGIEWCTLQAKALKASGVPSIHFYSMAAAQSIKRIAQQVY